MIFLNSLKIEQVLDGAGKPAKGGRAWRLLEPLRYQEFIGGPVLEIPVGYITDGASVPRWFWWFSPPLSGRYARAAVVHDYGCDNSPHKQEHHDKMFMECMEADGVIWVRRRIMFRGVMIYQSVVKGLY